MKRIQICLFALLLASIAFAEETPLKSHYLGGHLMWGFDYVWDNAQVKGTFGSSKDGVKKASLASAPGFAFELGASYWYRLNPIVGFVGEADFRFYDISLEGDVYSLPPEDPYEDKSRFNLYAYSFVFPVLVRVLPSPKFYLEAGPQFNLNVGGSIVGVEADDTFDFDAEGLGWALVLGLGCPMVTNEGGLTLGVRLAVDMTRIEKSGIVEMTKGAAYREASPMKIWSLQFNVAAYFL
jgi:hypothetical protein